MSQFKVIASSLNVRSGPGTKNPVIGSLPADTLLTPLDQSEDTKWFLVSVKQGSKKLEGWVNAGFVVAVETLPDTDSADEPPWLTVARGEVGVTEVGGKGSNKRIIEYHSKTSLHAGDDSVAWCSSFANFCMDQAGIAGTNSAGARSWLKWGTKLEEPRVGCVVVLKRGNPPNGHVAFYIGEGAGKIRLLGGNQGNQVNITGFPKTMLLGYRWPKNFTG